MELENAPLENTNSPKLKGKLWLICKLLFYIVYGAYSTLIQHLKVNHQDYQLGNNIFIILVEHDYFSQKMCF